MSPPPLVANPDARPTKKQLYLSGVIGTRDARVGFGNPTVVMIATLFVVGEGLSRTGATGWGARARYRENGAAALSQSPYSKKPRADFRPR